MAKGLEALLGANLDVTKEVYIPRLKTTFTVKALTNAETAKARLRATTGKDNVDAMTLSYVMISMACVDPDFNDKALKAHYGASDDVDCVGKALLPGEVQKLTTEISTLSGFGNEEELLEEAKN
ncbi:Phage XkdN-like tail assembly chaperone protein, TAC [Paenibacillus sp. CF095]|uniref:phage tail assembly chaperone n=1 Tax=Paenibacillus sp. CF095 TaxID=1881033 RepID=UPI000887594C|nr:hypothetical protein [Paenibacillus sp. CF095]SDC86927.1 Phage XkdN-like tail assembly chaperone protein, TAC [Paenibacillus sp. CF095]